MQRKKKQTFSSFVHPPPEHDTYQVLQKRLLNSRKASASNVPRNEMTTRSRMIGKMNRLTILKELVKILQFGSAEMEITATIFYRLPTYSVPIKGTPFSDIINPKQ